MALYYIILVSMLVTDVLGCTLESDIYKRFLSTNSPKYWFQHVRTFLHRNINLILQYYRKQKYFNFNFIPLNIGRTTIIKQSLSHVIQYENKTCSSKWWRMLKVLSTILVETDCVQYNNKWIYTLHKHYRLNITFEYLSFHLSYHHHCVFGNMIINSAAINDRFQIKYCGVHSAMSIFPPHSNVTLNIITINATKMSTIFSHSIMDSNNLITIPSLKHDLTNINKWTLYFLKSHIYLQKFIIRVKTYQYLLIGVIMCNNCSVNIHDGPDFLSPSLKPFVIHGNKTEYHHNYYQLYSTSSFQCVLFSSDVRINNDTFKYSSSNVDEDNTLHINPLKNLSHFKFPNNQFCSHRNICIILLETDPLLRFNVTIRSMSNSNQGDTLCSYAGLSMHDIINQNYIDISTTCKPSKRNIYSNTSRMLLVFYSFLRYGLFDVELEFSITMCKVAKVNICTGSYTYNFPSHFETNGLNFYVENTGCRVYQFTPNTWTKSTIRHKGIKCVTVYNMKLEQFIGKTADIDLTGSLRGKIINNEEF